MGKFWVGEVGEEATIQSYLYPPALQPATTSGLEHSAGKREKPNLDSLCHFCQHRYAGVGGVQFLVVNHLRNILYCIIIALYKCVRQYSWSKRLPLPQERSLRDNSSLVTVARDGLVSINVTIVIDIQSLWSVTGQEGWSEVEWIRLLLSASLICTNILSRNNLRDGFPKKWTFLLNFFNFICREGGSGVPLTFFQFFLPKCHLASLPDCPDCFAHSLSFLLCIYSSWGDYEIG